MNCTGWGFFIAANLLIKLAIGSFNPPNVIGTFVIGILGVLTTSIVRSLFHKLDIFSKTPLILWLYVTTLMLIVSTIFTISNLTLLNILYSKLFDLEFMGLKGFLDNWIILTLIFFIWSGLYISIRTLLLYKKSQFENRLLESNLKEAQLNTLMGQINPHFLFNTLNNIRSLVSIDPQKSRKMITSLADLLRQSLTFPKHETTTLEAELAVVRDFIDLASMQYGERLHFSAHIQDDCETTSVPPMVIQILVENSVKHGIGELKEGGDIFLKVSRDRQNLNISVTNPVNAERKLQPSSMQIGLSNIKERLRLLYGGGASLNFKISEDMARAKLIIPIKDST
jgi:sensor histidine kinase YesM